MLVKEDMLLFVVKTIVIQKEFKTRELSKCYNLNCN